ncbi:hypothetical protein H310_00338 [Aphanomyces invadans]|uniref:Uncharacterized protein n=1 Tax=Aphanomyces invadans TaxID=157072 RepID=A0A024UUA7_9STRA|nr:hypothetical protein H310_00338 [Aphanomyces invadans]ETW09899.1 hypothetical protein H310_00338 [Aphanomyces invadans]|eukprot:XP_008861310.1 hypothetical protein H310_00338 [Aphanomyces invadans]
MSTSSTVPIWKGTGASFVNTCPLCKMAASRAATFARTWLMDPSTYPILGIMACALSGATFTIVRYSTRHPDVHFDKDRRQDMFTYAPVEGTQWRAHRLAIAHGKPNPITDSFDSSTTTSTGDV